MGMSPSDLKRIKDAQRPKYSTKHAIAAIEKRVLDSAAFTGLTPSAAVVLLLLARNLEKGKNGRVWLSAGDAARRGIESKTLYRSLRQLRTHGLVYETRRGGNGQCSMFALTWLPLTKDTSGLHLAGFEMHAWRHGPPEVTKNGRDKLPVASGQNSRSTPAQEDKKGERHRDKLPCIELDTNALYEECISPVESEVIRA